ncbi:MAG TPA: YezD family protein [Nevskiales bacterium]|nr:YezD family protein [Nevskiales bacterium]
MSRPDELDASEPGTPVLHQILRALHRLRYGAVEIVVHDGRIVQIERREKLRLDTGLPTRSSG